MQRYRFRLESVLQHRAGLEQNALLAKARAQEELYLRQEALEHTRHLISQAMDTDQGGCVSPADSLNSFLYREYLTNCVAEQEVSVAGAECELDHRHQALVEARREKMMLEKLKERQLNSYQKQINIEEQSKNDEMAMAIYCRQQNGRF